MDELGAAVLLNALATATPDCILCLDLDQRIVFATSATRQMLGRTPAELRGLPVSEVLPEVPAAAAGSALARALAGEQTPALVTSYRHREGRVSPAAVSFRCLRNAAGDSIGVTLVIHADGSHRDQQAQLAEQRRQLSENVYRSIVDTVDGGLAVADHDGTTLLANQQLSVLLGRSDEELRRTDLMSLLGLAAAGTDHQAPGPVRLIARYPHPDGRVRELQVSRSSLRAGGAEPTGWLLMVNDVTEVRRTVDELRHQALHDPLTGLPNRQLFADRLAMAAARQERDGGGVGVLYLDLDGFKAVNDSRGHETGDAVLREFAARLGGAVRATDTVARLGGDEFAVICEDVDPEALDRVADRVHAAVREPVPTARGAVAVQVSIGVALAPPHVVTELPRRADQAMYRAKELGGGRTALADSPGQVRRRRWSRQPR